MKLALFYDTETTGLPLFNDPSEDPRQPHLVQLAARLLDVHTRTSYGSFDVTIAPDGWEIPQDVVDIHGITTAQAQSIGVPEPVALLLLCALWERCDYRVAHNETFDARIIRIGLKRYAEVPGLADADEWKQQGPAECTARMSTPILNLPPTAKMIAARRTHAKTPNLGEAYAHFMGKPLENAHTALADVDACKDIYLAMLDRERSA